MTKIKIQDKIFNSFDYLRVFSTFMIVLCHLFYIKSDYFFIGTYLSSFVEVFFILSALLLGLKYSNVKLTWINFFKNRIIRIIASYYPYLILLFCWIYLMHNELVSLKIFLAHVFFVNWFTRSFEYSYGHLWFLSMLMLCYIFIMTLSRINIKIGKRVIYYIILVVISAFLICFELNINPRIITSILLFTFYFYKGKIFLNYVLSFKISSFILFFLCVNLFALYVLYLNDGLIDYKFFAAILSSIVAITNVGFLIKIFMFFPKNKVINFFSLISFEIYLIHHPLILGKYAVINSFTHNLIINILFTLLIIISLSWVLYFLSKKVNKIIFNKLI